MRKGAVSLQAGSIGETDTGWQSNRYPVFLVGWRSKTGGLGVVAGKVPKLWALKGLLFGDGSHGDNEGIAGSSGDVQWMTAGNGIIHQEMPKGDRRG